MNLTLHRPHDKVTKYTQLHNTYEPSGIWTVPMAEVTGGWFFVQGEDVPGQELFKLDTSGPKSKPSWIVTTYV